MLYNDPALTYPSFSSFFCKLLKVSKLYSADVFLLKLWPWTSIIGYLSLSSLHCSSQHFSHFPKIQHIGAGSSNANVKLPGYKSNIIGLNFDSLIAMSS